MARQGKIWWGTWIQQRADFLGFRRHEDLAAQVGCTREKIGKWFALEMPPKKMRKGFDRTLCRALKINKEMLFSGYISVQPEDAPQAILSADHMFGSSPSGLGYSFADQLKLADLAALLRGGEMAKAIDYILRLIISENDDRRAVAVQIAERDNVDQFEAIRRGEAAVLQAMALLGKRSAK